MRPWKGAGWFWLFAYLATLAAGNTQIVFLAMSLVAFATADIIKALTDTGEKL